MTSEPLAAPTPWHEVLYGVFDEDCWDFIAAFASWRDAEDRAADLERDEHDFGPRGVMDSHARYYRRYSVDVLPADHPLAEQARP